MRLVLLSFLLLASMAASADQQRQPTPTGDTASQHQQPTPPRSQVTINNVSTSDNEGKADNKKSQAAAEPRPFLTHGETASTVIGLCVLAVSVLGWLAVRRQAQIMERTLRLQEATFTQWVVLENWMADEIGVGIDIQFDIMNPTNFPLTIDGVVIEIGAGKNRQTINDTVMPDKMLAPHIPYRISATYEVSEDRITAYREGAYPVAIDCQIVCRTVMNQKQGQHISGVLYCGKNIKPFFREWTSRRYDSTPDDEKEG